MMRAARDTTLGARLAHAIVRRRAWIVVAWLIVAALLLPQARRASAHLQVAARVEGSESDAVARLLADRFDSPFARSAVLVVTGTPSAATVEGRAALRQLVSAATTVHGVTHTLSYLDVPDSAFLGAGGATFAIVGLDARGASADTIVARLRSATAAALVNLRATHPRADVMWTGEDALNHDLRLASSRGVSVAERRALPLTLVLLLLAFGAAVAVAIPLGVGALAIALAMGCAAMVARVLPLSISLQSVVSMLGLGLGIDYTLLLVSRFREARAEGRDSEAAAVEAATHAGHSVLVSAAAVAVGFAALLAVPLADLRSIAVGGLLVVTTSALLAVTLVPGLLAWLGPRIEIGRVLRTHTGRESPRWRRWALGVARRPGLTLRLAGLPLVMLAAQASRLEPRLPRGDWLPRSAEAARGARALAAMGSVGVVQTLRVVVALPPGVTALDWRGWVATARIAGALVKDPRVRRVRSLP
jgi:putative drug exporter of the RND superfamily